MQRLNSQDEYFLDTDTATAPTHIGGLEIYRLPPGAGPDFMHKLYIKLKNSPVRAEPFNYKLVTQEPEQADKTAKKGLDWLRPAPQKKKAKPERGWEIVDNIKVEDHLYLHALPKPGGQRELGELVSRLHVNRLDRSRPLWETHLIEGLEGGRYAVYQKIHHSQFDGKRGMSLAHHTRSPKASTRGLPPIWSVTLDKAERAGKPKPAVEPPSKLKALASWGKALSSMSAARKNKPGEGVIAPYSAPQTILNGPLTARRRLGTQSLPIARMKALGAAIEGGATVNEILLAVCGGALRRYLVEQNALPEQPLIAACPVAIPRKEEGAAGSAVGQILVSLGTHVADPKQRLLAVVASSKVNKELMKAIEGEAYAHYTELSMVPQVLAAKGGFGHKVLNANLVISNVPGPREAQYTNGALLESMYAASMLLAGQALNITVSNFGDNLDMGIMACPDLCPSPQKIAVYAGEELTLLERAMGLKPQARKAASKTAARKRAAAKKPAPAKAAQETASTKKPAAKKVAAKKAPPKKAVVARVGAKAVVAKKVAVKKVAVKKAAVKKSKAGR